MTDYAGAYRDLRGRVTDLVRDHAGDVDTIAPATPDWRVRDVVSHLAGICDDILTGNLDGVGTDAWTDGQVARRRDWPVDRILSEWDEHGAAVEQIMGTFPEVIVGQMLYDASTHEHDIRGALDAPGARDSDAITIAYDWGTDRFGEMLGDRATFTFVTESGEKKVGSGDAASTVHTSRFELVRAFTGRRSLAQMGAYHWEGRADPGGLVLSDLFQVRADNLLE
jgi:hypothetical protein